MEGPFYWRWFLLDLILVNGEYKKDYKEIYKLYRRNYIEKKNIYIYIQIIINRLFFEYVIKYEMKEILFIEN